MPEFKLKKMFGKSQSSSKSPKHSPSHRVDTASGESGGRNERSHSPRMTASPEHHVPCVQSSGYGSRSSLSGSSFSGGGSKSNSLERQSHTGSDGGISSMSGSGTDDSGHSSMSSPLNLPMEQLQSFNAMYRAGQYQSTPNPYQLNVQGPPKNLSKHQMHHHTPTQSRHNISRSSRSLSTTTAPEQFFDGAGLDISFGSDEVFRSDHSPDRSSCRKQSSPSSRRDSPSSQRRDSPSSRRDSPSSRRDSPSSRRRDTKSRYVNLCYPILDKGSLYAEASETNSVPEPRSVDHGEEMNPQALHAYESDPSQEDYRNKIIFELQWQVSELHERCAQLQKEADLARDRLGSSMHSVTTFWSPELKKERSLRKDEASRCNRLYEQLVVRQAELKHHEVLKSTEKDGACRPPARDADSAGGDVRNLVEEKRAQEKERGMLQQRSDELEKHLEMQNQTLSARDASIKTLLDMLQDKREDDSGGEQSEQEVLQVQAAINANRIWELEATLQAKDTHLKRLKELKDSHASQSQALDHRQSTAASHPLSAMVEAKDSQILSLEKEVAVLEEKLLRSQEDVILGSYRELCTEDSVGMKGKHLHHEIQKVREELSRRERKLSSSQRHAESLQCQQQESLHHLAALKEQLADREQQAATLQTAVAGLQERIKNKDGTIERKRKENQALISDKQSLEAELAELKDQLDSREHNINVLKRKAEMYDDVLKEKDEQLYQARSRQACVPTIDSPVFSPEDAIAERDRQIERLRQLQSQSDRDHQEELELYIMTSQDLKTQMAAMRFELTAKQTELRELREEAGKLRGQKAQRETKMMQLELAAQDRTPPPQVNREDACTQTDAVTPGPEMWSSTDESLSGGLEWSTELPAQGPSLLEELQKKVSDMEEEKKEKEHQMEDMQDIIKEYREKVGTLKRNQQKEKEKNAQLLEAAKKREDSFTDDASHLSTAIEQKQSRIGELEEALRESVRITAQREMDMMELQTQIEASKTAMEEMRQEVEDMRASSRDYTSKLATLSRQLDDKDAKIRRLAAHQHCHIQELYEIKQEAVQAAIGEKEASIAVLEMSGAKKPRQLEQIQYLKLEKHRLEATLKDVTQSLAKLREGRKRGSGSTSDCTAAGTEVKGADKAGKKNYKDGSTTI